MQLELRPNRFAVYTDADRLEMVEHYKATGSIGKAARIVGCTPKTVAFHVTKADAWLGNRARYRVPFLCRRREIRGYVYWTYRYWNKDGKRKNQQIAEHRMEMERHLGRPLLPRETIHHKNGVRSDNRIENLELRDGPHGKGATHCRHCGKEL